MSTLTGTQVLLLVASETGHVYTFATPKLQPLITKQEGKNLIQACLNSPDHHTPVIPEYLPSGHHYENDLADDELATRPTSTVVQSNNTSIANGNMAASVAATAAQVFMNSGGHPAQYASAYQQQQQSSNSGPYWNGSGNPGQPGAMFAPTSRKTSLTPQQQQPPQNQQSHHHHHQQQQQQQQQQQMYHAHLQQQQLYQQYQQQQMNKPSEDSTE